MKGLMKNKGHVIVKLLVSLISVSAICTAFLNVQLNARQQVYYEDLSSLMSMQARSAFDRLSYHVKLAGYANTDYKKPLEIIEGSESDTLRVWHNDVEIIFYVDRNLDAGTLCEQIDGADREIVNGVKSLRIERPKYDLITVEMELSQSDKNESNKIVSRSYSTSIRLDN